MATRTEIAKVYVATFNRAADADGLAYWISDGTPNTTSLTNLEDIAAAMTESAEYQAEYAGLDREAIVTAMYQNLFNRAPDATGLDYWVNGEGSTIPVNKMIIALINGAQGDDVTIMDNKATVGLQFADAGLNDVTLAKTVMSGVTADPATVTAAEAVIADHLPQTFALTTGTDTLTGGAGDDVFNADLLTLNNGDTLDGKDGNDTLNVQINASITDGTTISNIETINLTSFGANNVDFTNITGVKTFKTVDSTGALTLNNVADTTVGFAFSGSNTNDITANYKAGTLTGTSDKLSLSLDAVKAVKIDVDSGFENFEVTNKGDSTFNTITVPGVSSLKLTGEGSVDFANLLTSSYESIVASDFTGNVYTGKDSDNDGYAQNAIAGNTNGSSILLGSGDDQIGFTDGATAAKANTIKLGAGDDTLSVTTNNGYNYIFAEDGDDTVKVDDIDANDLVDLGAGTDSLTLDLNVGNSVAVLKGVENLTIKGDAGTDSNVDINYSDTALKVNLLAEDDNSNLTVTNLTAGSTVEVKAKKDTTNDVEILKVTYKNVEDSTTIKVNTTVTAAANTDDITVNKVKDLTLDFAKAVDLDSIGADIVLDDKVETLKINAAKAFAVENIADGGTAALTSLEIVGQDAVTIATAITDEDKLTTLKATAAKDLTIGEIDVAAKLSTIDLIGKSVTLGEVGDVGDDTDTAVVEELSSVNITANDGDITLKPAADGNAAFDTTKTGTITLKAEQGSILVNDGTNDDDNNMLLEAADETGVTVSLTAKTAIGSNAGDNALNIINTKGDITLNVAGAAKANIIATAGSGDYTDTTYGVVNMTATNTGGGAFVIENDAAKDGTTSTINLGNAATGKTNVLSVKGVVETLTINGGSGNDTVQFTDPGDLGNFKTANIALGQGTNKLDVSGLELGFDFKGTDIDASNDNGGVVANFTASAKTIDGTDANSTADDVSVASLEIRILDANGDEDATNTSKKVVESGLTIKTSGLTEFVGTGGADVIFASNDGMTITGGAGADSITLGAGADTVVFGATAAANGSDTITSFTSTSDKIDLSAFETAGAILSVTGIGTINFLSINAGTVYFLSTNHAGDADTIAAAATALNGAALWQDADATAWIVLADDNSTSVYEFVDTAASGNGVAAEELTLVGTIDDVLVRGDISI